MLKYLNDFFDFMRPAYSRVTTFNWFIVIIIGIILKTDNYGVSSLIRSLNLDYKLYNNLLNFFHSSAYSIDSLMNLWQLWVSKSYLGFIINGRKVLIGDHTYTPKDGRKMPGVVAIHQNSETSSKPSYFRGHFWGCISLLVNIPGKITSIPLLMKIHQGLKKNSNNKKTKKNTLKKSSITSLILMAIDVAKNTESKYYLILDGFFASGNSFLTSAKYKCKDSTEQLVHLIIHAKKNVVAYLLPKPETQKKRGRKRKYGEKLKLFFLFDSWNKKFISTQATIYGKKEKITFLCLDLLWRPLKGKIRFVLANTSHGKIILMSSDLFLDPIKIIESYCFRITIETMFDSFKNIMCGFSYHFWSKYSYKKKRIPSKKNNVYITDSSNPEKSYEKIITIEKFVNLHVIALGLIQLISIKFKNLIWSTSNCWLRTFTSTIPSIFITKIAITNIVKNHLNVFAKKPIIALIISKQSKFLYNNDLEDSA
jgi:hypothetical protein